MVQGPDPARPAVAASPFPPGPGQPIGPAHADDPRAGLDPAGRPGHNHGMEALGRVHNGVVVLDGESPWPDGTVVTVLDRGAPVTGPPATRRPVRLPLVPSDRPGSRPLTAGHVAELLDDEDVPS